MAYEIVNARKGSSTIRVVGSGTVTVPLTALSTNTTIETINGASIKRLAWSAAPTGNVIVSRGATPNAVFELYGSGEIRLDEWGSAAANGSTGNIVISVAVGGTAVIEVSKNATFSTDLDYL